MDSNGASKLNVSLEPHLLEVLKPLPDLLPATLAEELKPYISDTPKDTIPYSILLAISKWARTSEGSENLRKHTPPLGISSYTMVSLLAGVKTSPERNFGSYTPPPEPEQLAERQKRERKEITAILNALLSVFGAGFSTWWAADKLHWKDQWRVLLALAASLIVAMAEAGLFIIWNSRRKETDPKSLSRVAAAGHKKIDPGTEDVDEALTKEPEQQVKESPTLRAHNLRQRQAKKTPT